MCDDPTNWNYPADLPVVTHREEILAAVRSRQVVIVVSDTGSGKTTQLPKMVAEALGDGKGRIGCTQPRRIAAASVAERVAEELRVPLGGWVGYQVRFEDRISPETRVKFMTDGILLAETQTDPQFRQYRALILDEAHERSLNLDFLMGYLKRLLESRRDLKVVISSATMDAASFAEFFADEIGPAPVIEAPGRLFPVEECFLPPHEDEELPQQVSRAVDWLGGLDPRGDVLVFLPGEREIRECAEVLNGRKFAGTEVLPLFARLGLGDQQRVFHPGPQRRIILATNVAETSLTIPRIACVIDSGVARVSRWSPARGVQRLQIEPISQASARQRKGRCGRVRDGICVRLCSEDEAGDRPIYTDPEIRRSSLAGVILRMKSLGLPDIEEFPFIDPPSPKAVAEGYRTLREVGALDRERRLTPNGRKMARLPVDPRLARMLIEAAEERCLAEVIPVVAALESNDPRERPAEKSREADAAHARWKDSESDFSGLLRLWRDVQEFRDGRGQWRRNALRKFCGPAFLNARRVMEWANVADELAQLLEREWKLPAVPRGLAKAGVGGTAFPYDAVHRSLLAGVPRQFGLWDRESKSYRSAAGGFFAVFPGSGLFGAAKRHEWLLAMELVETTRLWARRCAKIDPAWLEQVAPHLCRSRYGDAAWDPAQGAVYGKESVVCGGLTIVSGRRVHYGRVDPQAAREIFIRDGLLAGQLRQETRFTRHLAEVKEEIHAVEQKLRRPGGLWCEEALFRHLDGVLPADMHTAAAFLRWAEGLEDELIRGVARALDEDLGDLGLEGFPDNLHYGDEEFPLYYQCAPGERDDGVTLGVHIDQLAALPEWLPVWGGDGNLAERAEHLLRSLPKDYRRLCQPISQVAERFAERWRFAPKDQPLEAALAGFIREVTGASVPCDAFDFQKLPGFLVTKLWICDDEGNEIGMGVSVAELKQRLAARLRKRFDDVANAEIRRSGLTEWGEPDLPETVLTPGGAAFPALVDEGGAVGIQAFACAAAAAESHRAGLARLLSLRHAAQVSHLKKSYPLGLMAKVELPRLGRGGTASDDLLLLAAEGAMAGGSPRSPQEFAKVAEAARSRWFDAASRVGRALDASLDVLPEVQRWVDAHRSDRNLGECAADLEEQLLWMLRGRFAWRAGYARLLQYPRHLQAIQSRLKRISSLPIVKDLEKQSRIRRLWQPWFLKWSANPDDVSLWSLGWALSDWRAALFAPELPNPPPPSEKRIEMMLAEVVVKSS